MTAVGHDMNYSFSDRGVRLSRMRVPWTRGATSGVLLLIFGAWAAIVPFIGPYLNFAYTPSSNSAWQWTAARGWFEVAPGAAAFAAGLLLLGSRNRAVSIAASWLGIAAGAWLIVGPSLTGVLNQDLGTPDPASNIAVQALEQLFFFSGIGALILLVSAAALGRLSVQSVRDVAAAERRASEIDAATASSPPPNAAAVQRDPRYPPTSPPPETGAE